MSWFSAAFSTTLERKVRLLNGLWFDVVSSRPIFFNNGLITAIFQCLEKIPCCNEVLTILVIGLINEGSISFSSFIGIG